uniref:Fatty acid desaturase domain-containing protein n=1 Tax=Hanusia phi TaxID=3032 RepID=A0A7S0EUJ2_9CRYP
MVKVFRAMLLTRASFILLLSCSCHAFTLLHAPTQVRGISSKRLAQGARPPLAAPRCSKLSMSVSLDSSQFDKGDANPIDSIETLDKLVPRTKITELVKQTSDNEGLLQVAWHAACYAVCAGVTAAGDALGMASVKWVGIVSMAFVCSFIFMALHETVHRSAFRSRLLNDIFMHIAGFLCLRPALHYFYYHWAHHKFTGNVDKDSELQPSALDMDVSTWPGYVLYISGLPFWFDASSTTLMHALGRKQNHEHYLSNPKALEQVANEARVYLLLYLLLLTAGMTIPAFGQALVTFWVLPSLLGQPFLRFYLFAEHRGCHQNPNVLENTRTMSTNWFYRKMAWQMPYHFEHHAWPYVPFHKLKDANKMIQDAGGLKESACAPSGNKGYLFLNFQFLASLLPRGGERGPSGAA